MIMILNVGAAWQQGNNSGDGLGDSDSGGVKVKRLFSVIDKAHAYLGCSGRSMNLVCKSNY